MSTKQRVEKVHFCQLQRLYCRLGAALVFHLCMISPIPKSMLSFMLKVLADFFYIIFFLMEKN